MQPKCIMIQCAHKAKQTITEKGDGRRRQEMKDREKKGEVANTGWAEGVNE